MLLVFPVSYFSHSFWHELASHVDVPTLILLLPLNDKDSLSYSLLTFQYTTRVITLARVSIAAMSTVLCCLSPIPLCV